MDANAIQRTTIKYNDIHDVISGILNDFLNDVVVVFFFGVSLPLFQLLHLFRLFHVRNGRGKRS